MVIKCSTDCGKNAVLKVLAYGRCSISDCFDS